MRHSKWGDDSRRRDDYGCRYRQRRRGLDRSRRRDRRLSRLGEKLQRVEVPLWILGSSHSHVDERNREIGLAARADGPDRCALDHDVAAADPERAEV
jgi:hypothetical protein